MADEPEQPEGVEFVDPCITLADGGCWISDPDALDPDMECGAGVIAVQFSVERGLWYMTATGRKWVSAEGKKSPVRALTKT